MFVLVSAPTLARGLPTKGQSIFLAASVLIPLLVLVPLLPARFAPGEFAVSYAHWLLVTAFFFFAFQVRGDDRQVRPIVLANVVAGMLVASFAIYQVLGIPREWPATGRVLLPIQREPFRFLRIGGTYEAGGYTRPTSLFLEPSWMGGYLAWILVVAFVLNGALARRRGGAIFRLAAVLLPLLAILASLSWGAYVDLATVLIVFAVVFRFERAGIQRRLGPTLLVAAILMGLALVSPAGRIVRRAVVERAAMLLRTPIEEPPGSERIRDSSWVRWQNAEHSLELFRSHVAKGVGLGQFHRYVGGGPASATRSAFRDPWLGWLSISAEAGLFGSLALIVAIVLVFRGYTSGSGGLRAAIPALASLALVQQLHTGSYIDLWWWYPLSLGAALGRLPDGRSAHKEPQPR